MSLAERRRIRQQRREVRRETLAFLQENPSVSQDDLLDHIELEFGGFDPATMMLFLQLAKMIFEWWQNRN